jgi:plasmid segregation protein ParM
MILDKLRELGVDLRSNPAIFIGGGAALFRQYLESSPMVVQADFVPDPRANAIGYGLLAAGQLRKTEGYHENP